MIQIGSYQGMRMWGTAPHPAKETFWKKFLWNLQKPLGQKMNEAFFCPLKGKFPETAEQSTKTSPCPKDFEGFQGELLKKFPLARPPRPHRQPPIFNNQNKAVTHL